MIQVKIGFQNLHFPANPAGKMKECAIKSIFVKNLVY